MRNIIQKSCLVGLVVAILGTSGFSQVDRETGLKVHTPVFSKIHTVSVHVKDFQTFNNVFRFLSEDIELPKNWGQNWTPETEAKRMYASFWAGNICIEPCGPYDTDEFEGDGKAMFFAITFLPFESAQASAREFEARGLTHNGQQAFLSVTDPNLSSGNCGICIMDLGRESREKDRLREAELQTELKAAQGGPLGLIRVDEILVRYTSDQGRRRWESLLKPAMPTAENLWMLDNSPALRLIKGKNTGLAGMVWKVRSLATVTRVLKDRGMLGKVQSHQVQIAQEKACGLTICLRE